MIVPCESFQSSLLCKLILLVAQQPYQSSISGRTEYRPISASVLGSKGSDLALIQLVKYAFEVMQWRTRVDTGRFTFPLADNPRNVDDRHVSSTKDIVLEEPDPSLEWPLSMATRELV